jgi:hypothetical protein
MEHITLGEILTALTFIVSFITAIKYLSSVLKKQVDKTLRPIEDSIKELDVSQCKNYLVRFLAYIEQGNEVDEVEVERAYEIYDHYTNDLKQNSYIHKRWNELMEKKK